MKTRKSHKKQVIQRAQFMFKGTGFKLKTMKLEDGTAFEAVVFKGLDGQQKYISTMFI